MKNAIVLLLLLTGFLQSFPQQPLVTKRALIFAIGDYPPSSGWTNLSSLRDVQYIKNMLANQDFKPDNIAVISDKDATIDGIKKAFEDLIAKVNKRDIVVIHFSSHGEQVEADNNNKMDGLDECIVTYNAVYPDKSTDFQKDQAQYLRGHVIGSYLRRLRIALADSGDVIVFMDNCHSGSGTRGTAKIRGGGPPFHSKTFNPKSHYKSDSSLLYRDEGSLKDDESKMASYEVFSATKPEELDYETEDDINHIGVGSLTYAISKAFENIRASKSMPTYRALFANIQAIMNTKVPDQHPLLEGNGSDRLIFGGKFMHQMPYIEISDIDRDNNQIIIKQGAMGGLDAGARIAVYASGTLDTLGKKPLATGKIIKSDNFLSTAALDDNLKINNSAEGWVFVTEHVYNIKPFTINFAPGKSENGSSGFTSKDIEDLKKNIGGLSFLKIDANPDLLVTRGKSEDSIKVGSNGYLFKTIKNAITDSVNFKQLLESYARYKFLQTLSGRIEDVSVEVQLVPRINGKPDTNKMKERTINNTFESYEKDTLMLRIRNTGAKDVFVNILDMQPNGVINAILPNKKKNIRPEGLKIIAGGESMTYYVIIGPPYGTEVFKIIASETQIDLEDIVTPSSAGSNARGVITSMEKLIKKSYAISRGADVGSSDNANADASTSDLVFLIKPGPKK
jgi:hypothetical protein